MGVGVINALTRAVCWTAGVVEGVMNGLVGRRGEQWLPILRADEPFGELRAAILGRDRRQIARVLGAPVTASVGLGFVTQSAGPVTYWHASTWYYPYDPERREAIAIRFEGNRARAVDFIGGVGSACEA
jgi:hypothetical protein